RSWAAAFVQRFALGFDEPSDPPEGFGLRESSAALERSSASESARVLAQSKALSRQTVPAAVARAYAFALNRPPTKREQADAIAFIEAQMKRYRAERKSEARELALTDFAQVLFSLNEFIYVE